jgi:hypothetical protein
MHLDVMTSIVSRLPVVASGEMYCNTRIIRELRDEYIVKVQLTEDVNCSATVRSLRMRWLAL